MMNSIFNFRISAFLEKIGLLLFALILIFPYQFQLIKAILLALILISVFAWKNNICFSKKVFFWVLIYILMNVFSMSYGLIRGNPAPLAYFNVYFLWPIAYFLLVTLVNKHIFNKMIVVMRYSLFIILCLGIIAFVYLNINFIRSGDLFGYVATIRPGFPFIAISGGATTNVIYLYFFFLSIIFIDYKTASVIDYINLFLGILFIFFTSRRALMLDFVFSFILIAAFYPFLRQIDKKVMLNSYKRVSFLLLLFIVIIGWIVLTFDLFDFKGIEDFVGNAFGEDKSDPRINQAISLIDGWQEAVFLGNGSGVNAEVVRSEIPGTYELSYLAMLFERGLIGFIIFIFQYILLNYWGTKQLKREVFSKYLLASMVALNLFMLANASNPYLMAFDHIWVLFITLIFINLSTTTKQYENLSFDKGL